VNDRSRAVDLAHAADFALGGLLVRPSIREVEHGGATETLEPRIMQVLVALADAAGAVVSRDDLILRCWDGRIVGEDAINRVIGRLRRLAEDSGGAAFTIETIPRVGYRLKTVPAATVASESVSDAAAPSPTNRRRVLAVAAGVLILAAAVAAWWLTRPGQWQVDDFRIVVSTPLYESDPALAPNGAMIAYAAGPAPYAWHIFIRNLSDGQPIQFTGGPQDDDMQPAWSPQSDRIAFIRHRDGQPCTIIVKPVPGGDERIVGHCQEDDYSSLAWAPDGEVLYFSDRPHNHAARRILRLDLASGAIAAVTHPPDDITGDRDPKISPDGKRMTFIRSNKASGTQMLLDIASGALRPLPDYFGLGFQKNWIDNDTLIVSGGFTEPTLWQQPIAGKPRRLTLNTQLLGSIAAGSNHTFAIETFRPQIVLAAPPAKEGDAPAVYQSTTGFSGSPDFSAQGRLAFVHASLGGAAEIWVQDPGAALHQTTSLGAAFVAGLRWSPDGTKLAFYGSIVRQRTSIAGIYLINADGTGLRLFLQRGNMGAPAWIEGGRALLVPIKDVNGWRLWRVPLDRPDRAAPFSEYGWFAVRSSGAAIYAMGTRVKGIWRIDGKRQYIATLRKRCTEAFMECQGWVVAGNTLVYADHLERARPRLILHNLTDGSERSLLAPGLDNSDQIAMDPVTGKLLYTYDGLADSDIALFHLSRR